MPITVSRDRPTLPPADQIDHPAIRAAVERWEAAKQAAGKARQDATELEQARPLAVEKDREKYADALTAGRKDPGTPATDAADAKIAAAVRKADAAKLVQDRALDALRDVIAEHGDEWSTMIDERLAAARQEWTKALDGLAARHAGLQQATALTTYVRSEGRLFKAGAGLVPLRRSGSPDVGVSALIDALRVLGGTPQPAAAKILPTELAAVA